MLKAKLMIIGGDAVQTEVQLKLPTTIGRGRESNLTVPHALVSRRHTEIIERDGRLFVRDLGSLNGTFVNNTRIVEETALDPDQLLTLGNITFRAVYEIGDDADTGRISANDTEVINIQQSDTEKVASESDLSSSSRETIPVDSLTPAPRMDKTPAVRIARKRLTTTTWKRITLPPAKRPARRISNLLNPIPERYSTEKLFRRSRSNWIR